MNENPNQSPAQPLPYQKPGINPEQPDLLRKDFGRNPAKNVGNSEIRLKSVKSEEQTVSKITKSEHKQVNRLFTELGAAANIIDNYRDRIKKLEVEKQTRIDSQEKLLKNFQNLYSTIGGIYENSHPEDLVKDLQGLNVNEISKDLKIVDTLLKMSTELDAYLFSDFEKVIKNLTVIKTSLEKLLGEKQLQKDIADFQTKTQDLEKFLSSYTSLKLKEDFEKDKKYFNGIIKDLYVISNRNHKILIKYNGEQKTLGYIIHTLKEEWRVKNPKVEYVTNQKKEEVIAPESPKIPEIVASKAENNNITHEPTPDAIKPGQTWDFGTTSVDYSSNINSKPLYPAFGDIPKGTILPESENKSEVKDIPKTKLSNIKDEDLVTGPDDVGIQASSKPKNMDWISGVKEEDLVLQPNDVGKPNSKLIEEFKSSATPETVAFNPENNKPVNVEKTESKFEKLGKEAKEKFAQLGAFIKKEWDQTDFTGRFDKLKENVNTPKGRKALLAAAIILGAALSAKEFYDWSEDATGAEPAEEVVVPKHESPKDSNKILPTGILTGLLNKVTDAAEQEASPSTTPEKIKVDQGLQPIETHGLGKGVIEGERFGQLLHNVDQKYAQESKRLGEKWSVIYGDPEFPIIRTAGEGLMMFVKKEVAGAPGGGVFFVNFATEGNVMNQLRLTTDTDGSLIKATSERDFVYFRMTDVPAGYAGSFDNGYVIIPKNAEKPNEYKMTVEEVKRNPRFANYNLYLFDGINRPGNTNGFVKIKDAPVGQNTTPVLDEIKVPPATQEITPQSEIVTEQPKNPTEENKNSDPHVVDVPQNDMPDWKPSQEIITENAKQKVRDWANRNFTQNTRWGQVKGEAFFEKNISGMPNRYIFDSNKPNLIRGDTPNQDMRIAVSQELDRAFRYLETLGKKPGIDTHVGQVLEMYYTELEKSADIGS